MPAVDLHVHSCHSDQPYSWFLRTTQAAECYTPIHAVHALAKRRGMDLVTLADHDTIDGALALRERFPDDTFISVEVSGRFPEDGCIVHVIAFAIDERHHKELQRLRRNVYELAAYLERHAIPHFWCHPFSQVNGRLTPAHIRRCFLMFRGLEMRNGTRDPAHEEGLLDLTRSLTRAHLERWADDHPETPFVNREAVWARVAGSDDHGGLAIARAHTRFSGPATVEALVAAWRTRATIADGDHGGGTTLAHNCYGVLAGYMDARGRTDSLHDTRGGQILKSLVDMRDAASVSVPLVNEDKLRAVAEQALADGWRGALSAAGDALAAGRVGDAADTLGALAKAFALELPYLLAHRFHARDRRSARRFARDLGANGGEIRPLRVAVFTDTIDDVNGVALGLRRLQQAANRLDLDLRIVACGERTTDDGIERIPSVYERELAEYPGLRFSVPHVAPLLRYLVEEEIDLVQCATPAPVGIAALVCARVAGIPVIGQYHTDVPEYALRLTGDPTAAGLVKTLVGWFYASMDRVLVPSAWAGRVATSLGVSTDRIARVPRGVEIARFARTGRGGSAEPIVLYVGRLSREKSIERLFAAFREVVREVPRAQLQIVGGGPQRPELERIAPPNVSFTGVLSGRALVDAYHGAAVFTFPSETETFGNAVAEAQAAGLPAIVAAETATAELIVPGATGFAVDWRDPHSAAAPIIRLLRDPDTRARMAREAAHHASRFEIERAARATFELYDQLVRREAPASSNDLVA